jgi:SAM-dependent methyltransferase
MADVSSTKDDDRAEWDRSADGLFRWSPVLEAGLAPITAELLRLAAIREGMEVLDVATGVGEPALSAATAVGPSGHVVATDVSPAMLRHARDRAVARGIRNVEFRELDIEGLSLLDGPFDAALCRFGLMFVTDVEEGLRGIRGVLRDRGRFAAAVWASAPEVPLISLPRAALGKYVAMPPPPPDAQTPFRLADVDALTALMERAGFDEIRASRVRTTIGFASGEQYADAMTDIASSLIALIEDGALARSIVIDAIAAEARSRFGGGAIDVPVVCYCFGARAAK